MRAHGLAVDENPFGTLFNPLSIATCMEVCLGNKALSMNHYQLHNGLWHSFLHHGRFSHADRATFEQHIAESIVAGKQALQAATTIIITFGTAWVYERNGEIVSNCHKLPEKEFTRRRLTVEEIVAVWSRLLQSPLLQSKRVIFTVSPIRHVRDGLHENQVSKATLLLAIEQLQTLSGVAYFPAYEIVLDELRDYRFFAEDMLHPSSVAVAYIWKRFTETYFSAPDQEQLRLQHKAWKHAQHCPLHD